METIGSFLIVLSFTLSRKDKRVRGSLFIWLILLILSLFMNLQFFVGVFLFYLKNIYQKNENFKNVLITLVVLIFFVFAGVREIKIILDIGTSTHIRLLPGKKYYRVN